jgi:hypothetical protein
MPRSPNILFSGCEPDRARILRCKLGIDSFAAARSLPLNRENLNGLNGSHGRHIHLYTNPIFVETPFMCIMVSALMLVFVSW